MTNIRDIENLAQASGTTPDLDMQPIVDKTERLALAQFNMAQVASTYTLLTATGGDVFCEVKEAYVKTAATGLTSVNLNTGHTTPKSIVASTALAALTLDAILSLVTAGFVLPSGKTITGTIVGTGTAGLMYLVINYVPLTPGATLS